MWDDYKAILSAREQAVFLQTPAESDPEIDSEDESSDEDGQ